jgi:hypothetical protein
MAYEILAKFPNATLVYHRSNGILYYSQGLWYQPADAVDMPECQGEFHRISPERAKELFGDKVPNSPGEWSAVPNIWDGK